MFCPQGKMSLANSFVYAWPQQLCTAVKVQRPQLKGGYDMHPGRSQWCYKDEVSNKFFQLHLRPNISSGEFFFNFHVCTEFWHQDFEVSVLGVLSSWSFYLVEDRFWSYFFSPLPVPCHLPWSPPTRWRHLHLTLNCFCLPYSYQLSKSKLALPKWRAKFHGSSRNLQRRYSKPPTSYIRQQGRVLVHDCFLWDYCPYPVAPECLTRAAIERAWPPHVDLPCVPVSPQPWGTKRPWAWVARALWNPFTRFRTVLGKDLGRPVDFRPCSKS